MGINCTSLHGPWLDPAWALQRREIFHAESFQDRVDEYSLPQANCAAIGVLRNIAGDFDSEELACGTQVRDPVFVG